VSSGSLEMTSPATVPGLSHSRPQNPFAPIFDKEKEQQRLQEAQKIGEIGAQVMDIARTQGDLNGLKAAQEKLGPRKENATEKERAAYMDMLRGSDVYKAEMAKYGTGSAIQQGLQAATAAIQGLAGGDMAKAIAGAASPYLAEVIHKMATDPVTGKVNTEANLMAHAVVGAVVAQINGNSALAGASGAAVGEFIAQQLYPNIKREDLTEEQRQTISSLSTLAAGLAGGLTGDSSADAVAGAQAGKTAAENNNLAILRTGAAACAEIAVCSKAVIDLGLGALIGVGVATSAIEELSGSQKTNVMLAAMSGDQDLIDNLSPSERAAYEEWKGNQGLITVFPTGEKDPTGGKLENPIPDQNKGTSLVTPDQSGGQGASNTGNTDGAVSTGGSSTSTPIAEQNPDDLAYLALKGKEAQEAAKNLGFGQRIPPQKAPFNSHGQPVYFDGKNYISPDVDSHNVTNGWKMFDRKGERMGTYDSNLNRIKD
jgi:filamentous hemagglutinin